MSKDSSNVSIYNLLDAESIKGMRESLTDAFLRLGINVAFEMSEKKIYDGSLLIKATSTTFNTVPALFHDIHIECSGALQYDSEHDVYNVCMNCEYKYNLFCNGGRNAARIGDATFVLIHRDKDNWRPYFEGLYVR